MTDDHLYTCILLLIRLLLGVTDIEAFLTDMLESIREGVHLSHPGFMSKCPSAGMMQGLIGLLLGRSFNRMPSKALPFAVM